MTRKITKPNADDDLMIETPEDNKKNIREDDELNAINDALEDNDIWSRIVRQVLKYNY